LKTIFQIPYKLTFMKENAEISTRIHELKEKVVFIEQIRQGEMQKPFYSRNYQYLTFLHREQKIYEFGLSQLLWLLG
jgi:hypothetical protein